MKGTTNLVKVEEFKSELIKKSMTGVSPVAIVCFDEGVAILTFSTSAFRKVREVHDNVLFAAAGEHQEINQIHNFLVDQSTEIENILSARDITVEALIDNPKGVAGLISSSFKSFDAWPKMIEFVLCSIRKGKPRGIIINPYGKRKYLQNCAVIGDDSLNESLTKTYKENVPHTAEEAIGLAQELLLQAGGYRSSEMEIGILSGVGIKIHRKGVTDD